MKIMYRSSLPALFALLLVLASCSPKYGAHFAPSKQAPQVALKEKSDVAAPLQAEAPAEEPAAVTARAEESGATEVVTDKVVAAEKPAEKINTAKQHRKAMRALKNKLKGMTKEERQVFKDQVMRQLKEQNLSMHSADAVMQDGGSGLNQLVLTIVTIFIPPLGVFLHQGEINTKFWISLVLTLLFFFPGLIYSLLVIFDVV